jgi:uncharacterized Zn finger protein
VQARCPKCGCTAFRMLPESQNATEVECLNCGHVAPFIVLVVPQVRTQPRRRQAADDEPNGSGSRRHN